jgi:hypothetical protein
VGEGQCAVMQPFCLPVRVSAPTSAGTRWRRRTLPSAHTYLMMGRMHRLEARCNDCSHSSSTACVGTWKWLYQCSLVATSNYDRDVQDTR